ncbi:helix-turn-helix domain-containing protein [Flavitalea sp. BT771]|uniref:helix-turn-helix domain-containing protein n=1 Tax=Flavitalea sp. BT771 TaxID=3063329 RepID=UPI0026E3FFBD|nr:helix-turn-helix domain-containing protein [Flavitalea sp. BT771]MDO6432982.1 helix-turn-helix domain-containing protein [Flavitalea sp. BT771]MDV6221742.1 helix-turn-helix domain-containing protein [Flavitalea sp. BT771]
MKNIPIRHIQVAQKEPDFFGGFSIRDVRTLLDGKDMVQELHRHDFFYVLALKKGAGRHEIDFTSYEVCDHSVAFMRPGQVHQLTLKAGAIGYLLAFETGTYYPNDKGSKQLLRKAGIRNHYLFEAARFKKLIAGLDHLFQEYTDKQEGYQKVIKAYLDIFLVELVRQHRESAPGVVSYAQEKLEELLELLETDISHHKEVSAYAAMLHLSPYQLNAITKAMLGKTCSALIHEYIILESKRLLLATSNQVSQIAYQLGYEDVAYFIRFFKKHTGHSPEVFRQHFR